MTRYYAALCLVCLLCLAGCSTIEMTQTHRFIYLPSRPIDVEIFMTVPQGRPYVELASMTVSEYDADEVEELYQQLREKVAPLGATGVIILNQGLREGDQMWLTAVAIRWKTP